MTENGTVHNTGVAVWGLGLIGYTLAGELARSGRRCLIMDVDPTRVERLGRGELPFQHLPDLPYDYAAEVANGSLEATTDASAVLAPDYPVQVLCVPTERDGEVDDSTLAEVVRQVAVGARANPVYLVIESTIAPSWVDTVVHPAFAAAGRTHGVDYHLGVSPRRDWLTANGHTMTSIPKIIGGDTRAAVEVMRDLYGPICGVVLEAADTRHAALVKVVENYFRYRDILLANELARLMPGYDMTSVLRLASSKWNMNAYHPSLGIGGYCVPLAKDYLGQETGLAAFADELHTEEEKIFAETRSALRTHGRFRTVAVLGIAYAPGMKIHTRSPGVRIAKELAGEGSTVLVHDPLYTPEEITDITGAAPLWFPEDLRTCDSVLVMTDHDVYRQVDHQRLLAGLSPDACLIDNLGTWSDRQFPTSLRYREVGGAGYFTTGQPGTVVATCRGYLRQGHGADVLASAEQVTAIDRRYIGLEVDGVRRSMTELAESLARLRDLPAEEWTDSQVEVLCVLHAVNLAKIRIEQVGISGDLEIVAGLLAAQHTTYRARLAESGEQCGPAAEDLPWWETAAALPGLRTAIDRHCLRLLEIDGRTWHRAERLLPRDRLTDTTLPSALADDLATRYPRLSGEGWSTPQEYVRAAASAEITAAGTPLALIELIMLHATEDPRHPSDHATLMCPRGVSIAHPGRVTKEDFGVFVVFHRDFVPADGSGVGDRKAIRKAMYAHHAAKKVRVARKVYAPDDTYTQSGLTDDLGSRGIFFNENAHHRGHVLAGVSTAMRSLMAIDVDVNGERRTVHDLTDWRLSRASEAPADRYSVADYPSFRAYGLLLRAVVEVSVNSGVQLPAMLGEWR